MDKGTFEGRPELLQGKNQYDDYLEIQKEINSFIMSLECEAEPRNEDGEVVSRVVISTIKTP